VSDQYETTIDHVAASPSGAQAAPVFDEGQMSKLVALMGPGWVTKALRQFSADVELRLESLDAATPSELAGITHAMIMMAAQCGFTELFNVAEVVQREARQGFGLNHVAELRAACGRALAAMRSYTPRP
jgi:hypothetical protein